MKAVKGSEIIFGKDMIGTMDMVYSSYRAKYESIVPFLEKSVVVPEETWTKLKTLIENCPMNLNYPKLQEYVNSFEKWLEELRKLIET